MNRGVFNAFPTNYTNDGFCVNDRDLNKCSGKQRSYIYGLLDKTSMNLYDLFNHFDYDYQNAKDMTYQEASECIDYLKEYLGWF